MSFARNDLLFTMSDNTHVERAPVVDARTVRICFSDETAGSFSGSPIGFGITGLVEPDGIEPTTSCLQSRRSPN